MWRVNKGGTNQEVTTRPWKGASINICLDSKKHDAIYIYALIMIRSKVESYRALLVNE